MKDENMQKTILGVGHKTIQNVCTLLISLCPPEHDNLILKETCTSRELKEIL